MDLYAVLGLDRTATKEQIKAAFKALAKKHHPDVNGGVMSEEYRNITQAHAILSNEMEKQIYDLTGHLPGTSEAEAVKMAHNAIENMLTQIMDNMTLEQMESADIINMMLEVVSRQIGEFGVHTSQLKSQIDDTIKRHEMMKKRLSASKAENSAVFFRLLDKRESSLKASLGQVEKAEAIARHAEAILKDCKFKRKESRSQANRGIHVSVMSSTGASGSTTYRSWPL